MAKKAKGDRSDPKSNKSLAIRTVLAKMPKAKAADVAAAVESEYGHKVAVNMVYLVKSKVNVKKSARKRKQAGAPVLAGVGAPNAWIQSIKLARQLLQSAGSVENSVAILKAVEG